MDRLRLKGGRPLRGRVRVGGAKNAALPAMAAATLTAEPVELDGVPEVRDVSTMARLLEMLGARVELGPGRVRIELSEVTQAEAPYDLVKTMRASVLALGPLVARAGHARVSLPGGCAIGARPINYHLAALERLGVSTRIEHGYVIARADRLRGAELSFEAPTVTGTENVLMAAVLADGETVLHNAACEPEVIDLCDLLVAMGADIDGAGTPRIRVRGVGRLGGARHRVIPDRIEAGTFLAAAASTAGEVLVEGARADHLGAVIGKLREAGATVLEREDGVLLRVDDRLKATDVRTAPHPGFPTDMQAQFMALLSQAEGISVVTETVFENRFMHVAELRRLGARIRLDDSSAIVKGPTPLSGATVMATDLRASASLVLAALVAEGETIVERVYHLDRGYERIEEKLRGLGARVERLAG
jgi:UDP-N-acetylglucosamine 1-carboxyvinyltransferase